MNSVRKKVNPQNYEATVGSYTAKASIPVIQSRTMTSNIKKPRSAQLRFDMLLLLVMITLVIFGLIMVFSASYDYSLSHYKNANTMIIRQVIFLIFGLCVAGTLLFIDYHYWRKFAVPALLITIFLLILVISGNDQWNNATRTLRRGSIQPSELAKFMTVVYLGVWLYARRERLDDVGFGLIPLAVILGIIGGLILLQPDLSAVITIMILGGLMFFLAGGDLKQIGILLVVALLVGLAIVKFTPTGSERIMDYFAGLRDPTEGSYHVQRAFEALANGGWFGVGIGKASTKFTGLPVPPTDSIFAVISEETGTIGGIALIVLYTILLWRGLAIAHRAPDELGSLLAAGLSLWISIEAFINISVMVNLLPFAGNALPLISAGGSSLVMTLAAIGILLNISRQSERGNKENDKFFNSVANLRWRDRRRRVSGDRRTASLEVSASPEEPT